MSHLTVEAKSEEGCFYFADDLCVRKPFSPFCIIFSLTFSLLVLTGREYSLLSCIFKEMESLIRLKK